MGDKLRGGTTVGGYLVYHTGNLNAIAVTSLNILTSSEISYLSGVTSAIQTQINGKAPTSHASSATTYGLATTANYGHIKLHTTIADGVTDGAPDSNAVFDALALKANLVSPTFTGTPTLPTGTIAATQTVGNSSTAIATTAFVNDEISNDAILKSLLTTTGDIIYASAASTPARLAAGTSGYILKSNGTAAPSWLQTLPVANGGTGTTSAPTQGGVIYGASTSAHASTAAGTSGQALISNGTSAPTWQTLDLSYLPDATVKKSVRVATTGNVTLTGTAPLVVDGVTLTAITDRILVWMQTLPAENGVYVASILGTGATGTWTRAADANTITKLASAIVAVDSGTLYGGLRFDTDLKTTDTLGTTAVVWNRVVDTGYTIPVTQGGTGAITAAAALTNLGLTATAVELNYTDGVTSAIQTQINGKAPTSHASTATTYGLATTTNYGHIKLHTTIADGVTDGAPDSNAVFDALALKAPTSHAHGGITSAGTIGTVKGIVTTAATTGYIEVLATPNNSSEYLDGTGVWSAPTFTVPSTFATDITVNSVNIGKGSGSSQTNTRVGENALSSNTTGAGNVAIGNNSLAGNTIGSENVSIGHLAMNGGNNGNNNVAIGGWCFSSNQNGAGNVAIGYSSLYSNYTGIGNIAIGDHAGNYETGSNKLYIDSINRGSEANGQTQSFIYGDMSAKTLLINAVTTINGGIQIDDTAGSNGFTITYDNVTKTLNYNFVGT